MPLLYPNPAVRPAPPSPVAQRSPAWQPRILAVLLLLLTWASIYLLSLTSPPLLDDADATHAQAAQAMLRTGDWVTLHVDGIRYLEKPPLPYWITAISLRLFGNNSFAVHLPLALTVLALAALAGVWGRHAFLKPLAANAPAITFGAQARWATTSGGKETQGERTGFYAALFTLTSAGVFLFTRILIPDALLSLLLAFTLYAALRALELQTSKDNRWALAAWIALAAAVLTKGLVAMVFVFGAFALYLPLAGETRLWRRLHPLPGSLLFLAVAAPWHILAGLRNRGGANGHGFFWFYFVNEHVLRFLGRRSPPDYNKLPTALYWSLHLVWLFPWSFFVPAAALTAWQTRRRWWPAIGKAPRSFAGRSVLLLVLFSALVLLFFSLSTNQEYYTFPVYLPLLLLTAATLSSSELATGITPEHQRVHRLVLLGQWAIFGVGLLAAGALAVALWTSRRLPYAPDIGNLLAHRGVGGYTLSMSHFFDLTGAAFAALRLPAALACLALSLGPAASLVLRLRNRAFAATVTLALSSTLFLVAAGIALRRFAPLLSSGDFAAVIQHLETTHAIAPDTEVLLFGDQALGSSLPFYLQHPVELVDGRSTSMLFGSTFPDAPAIFLTHGQLQAAWGRGPRKLLFVPSEHRAEVETLLGRNAIPLYQSSGKTLLTDRPLVTPLLDRDAPRPKQ